jgi:putative endonuclease
MPSGTGRGHLIRGAAGEDLACEYLVRAGYRVLDRNWSSARVELDLVMEKDQEVVFVEVKTRGPGAMAPAVSAVDAGKRSRLAKAASLYLSRRGLWERPCRFDVVTVTLGSDGTSNVEHVENAFDCSQTLGGGHTPWQPW